MFLAVLVESEVVEMPPRGSKYPTGSSCVTVLGKLISGD